MRRIALALLLGAAAIGCFAAGVARRPGGGTAAAGAPAAVSEPLLTADRVPALGARSAAIARTAAALDAALGSPGGAAPLSCVVVAVGGVPVYGRSPATPLLPASNLKLLTAYAALRRLGPDRTLVTSVVAAQRPTGGVVDGPLFLVGGGDPLLSTPGYRASQHEWTQSREPFTSLDALAAAVRAAGITRVAGGVVGDDSRFDGVRALPSWKASYVTGGQIGPVGALVVDGGFAGRAAEADPAAAAAAAFAALLARHGVTVGGPDGRGRAPAGAAAIAHVDSPPLTTVLGEMLRESDNLAAEMLTKELGYETGGQGTWAAGVAAVRSTLTADGLPTAGLAVFDGSGLDRGDRASCQTLVAVLDPARPAAAQLDADLPLGGSCGTLVGRFAGRPAAGRVRAKTGSLIGVGALTGTVSAPSPGPVACPPPAPAEGAGGEAVTFSFLVNGIGSDAARQAIEDRVADAVATLAE